MARGRRRVIGARHLGKWSRRGGSGEKRRPRAASGHGVRGVPVARTDSGKRIGTAFQLRARNAHRHAAQTQKRSRTHRAAGGPRGARHTHRAQRPSAAVTPCDGSTRGRAAPPPLTPPIIALSTAAVRHCRPALPHQGWRAVSWSCVRRRGGCSVAHRSCSARRRSPPPARSSSPSRSPAGRRLALRRPALVAGHRRTARARARASARRAHTPSRRPAVAPHALALALRVAVPGGGPTREEHMPIMRSSA